jgi:hypothetical protein
LLVESTKQLNRVPYEPRVNVDRLYVEAEVGGKFEGENAEITSDIEHV